MTSAASIIKQLIDKQVGKIQTLDIGTVSGVSAFDRVNVKVKHQVAGQVMEYADVPVLPAGAGQTRLYSTPAIGATVVVAFFKFEIAPQLEKAATITRVNEQAHYVYPVVLAAIDTADSLPPIIPEEGETILCHSTGSYIRFTATGCVEIVAPRVTVNGTEIPQELPV